MNKTSALVTHVGLASLGVLATVLCTTGTVEYGRQAWDVLADLAAVRATSHHRIQIGPIDLLDDAPDSDDATAANVTQSALTLVVDASCPVCDSTLNALIGRLRLRRNQVFGGLTIAAPKRTPTIDAAVSELGAAGLIADVRIIQDLDSFESASGISDVPVLLAMTPGRQVAAVLLGGASGDALSTFFKAVDSFHDDDGTTVIRGSTPKSLVTSVVEPAVLAVGDGSDADHPVRVGGDIPAPRELSGEKLPPSTGAGASIVELTLDPTGRVVRVRMLVNPVGDDQVLSSTLRTWKYAPVTVDGQDVWATLTTSIER
jgi:hypothetical protein